MFFLYYTIHTWFYSLKKKKKKKKKKSKLSWFYYQNQSPLFQRRPGSQIIRGACWCLFWEFYICNSNYLLIQYNLISFKMHICHTNIILICLLKLDTVTWQKHEGMEWTRQEKKKKIKKEVLPQRCPNGKKWFRWSCRFCTHLSKRV